MKCFKHTALYSIYLQHSSFVMQDPYTIPPKCALILERSFVCIFSGDYETARIMNLVIGQIKGPAEHRGDNWCKQRRTRYVAAGLDSAAINIAFAKEILCRAIGRGR